MTGLNMIEDEPRGRKTPKHLNTPKRAWGLSDKELKSVLRTPRQASVLTMLLAGEMRDLQFEGDFVIIAGLKGLAS